MAGVCRARGAAIIIRVMRILRFAACGRICGAALLVAVLTAAPIRAQESEAPVAPDAPAADAQDAISPEEKEQRLEAARSFMQTYPIETMWGDIVARLVAGQPDDFVAFVRANAEKTDYGVLRERMRESLIAVFTAEELSALADFSRQTEGRVVRKFTPLTAQLLPGFQAEFFKLFVLPPADPAPENPPAAAAAAVEDAEAESPPAADSDSDSDSESSAS